MLGLRGRKVLADEIGANRKFPMTSVYQNSKLYRRGPSKVQKGGDRRTDRPPGEQDVINQDDGFTGYIDGNPGRARRGVSNRVIVAIERDVETAVGDGPLLDPFDRPRKPRRKRLAPAHNADQYDVFRALIPLHDFVGDPS